MTDRVIYSMCCRLPGGDDAAFRRHLEMVELWLAHLRGPGGFTGRVLLLTNQRNLPLGDVELMPLDDTPSDRRQLFLQRVLVYDRLPVRPGERWMQLDVDTLTVRPVEPLFAGPGETALRAAPSGLTPLDPMHARSLLRRPARLWYGRVLRWNGRLGVSACLTSCTGEHWPRLMGQWAAEIRHHEGKPTPILGDQSFLNLAHMTGRIKIAPLPAGSIHHVREEAEMEGDAAERASVLHFPNARKLDMMKEMSLV